MNFHVSFDVGGGLVPQCMRGAILCAATYRLALLMGVGVGLIGFISANGVQRHVASEVVDGISWRYLIRDGRAIVGGGGNAVPIGTSGHVRIPSRLGGAKVTDVGFYAFSSCSNITSVFIPEGVARIGCCAFSRCSAITEVYLPGSLTNIEHQAFYGCKSLMHVEVPETVKMMGQGVFANCARLRRAVLPSTLHTLPPNTFWGAESLQCVRLPPMATNIMEYAFYQCKSLREVEMPRCMTRLDVMAFAGCVSLDRIEIPAATHHIAEGAFDGCTSINEVVVSPMNKFYSVKDNCLIGMKENSLMMMFGRAAARVIPPQAQIVVERPFDFSHGLATLVVPSHVRQISPLAFSRCRSLESIEVDGGSAVYSSWDGLLYSSDWHLLVRCPGGRAEVAVRDGTTVVGAHSFDGCRLLHAVILPETLRNIEASAFSNCTSLKSLDVPSCVTNIGLYAFSGCSSIETIGLPKCAGLISEGMFSDCTRLRRCVIPEGIQSIGHAAFANCRSLEELDIPRSVTNIGALAFVGCHSLKRMDIRGEISTLMLAGAFDGDVPNCVHYGGR